MWKVFYIKETWRRFQPLYWHWSVGYNVKQALKNQENGDNKETICMHEKPSLTFHLKFKLCIAYYPLSSEACHDQGPQQSPPIRYKARTPRRLLSQLSLFLFKKVSRTKEIPCTHVQLGSRKKKIKSIHSSDRRWVIRSTFWHLGLRNF